MKLIFCTDFHGNHDAYKKAFKEAEKHEATLVLGGDILPKNFPRNFMFTLSQKEFLKTWLLPKLDGLRQKGVVTYAMFGNDDAAALLPELDKAENWGILKRLDRNVWHEIGWYTILGIPWVTDYPFSLKDWCCGDLEPIPCPSQYGPPCITDKHHFVKLSEPWEIELERRPTLKQRLDLIPEPPRMDRAILVTHDPPSHGGLDLTGRGERVGSEAVLRHLRDHGYLLSLHGHIHEAPNYSDKWYARIVDTLAVQPGATPPCHIVVDLEQGTVTHPLRGSVVI